MSNKEIQEEMKYREWREAPQWYCVKTTYNSTTGKVTAEVMLDEKTKLPIAIQQAEKPQDGVFEDLKTNSTVYYSYHAGYEDAMQQVNMIAA